MPGVGIILQARMGSTRLPGKVLRRMVGLPLLARVIHRLKQCSRAEKLILATSTGANDDPVAALGKALSTAVFRGSENDVLERYLECARDYDLNTIVRATGDNPFVDPQEADRLIEFFLENDISYACNFPAFKGGLPIGTGLEIFSREALEESDCKGKSPHHREHVNEYIQENPQRFRRAIPTTPSEKTAPALSFTVDTPEQFAQAEALILAYRAQYPDLNDADIPTAWLIQSMQGST